VCENRQKKTARVVHTEIKTAKKDHGRNGGKAESNSHEAHAVQKKAVLLNTGLWGNASVLRIIQQSI